MTGTNIPLREFLATTTLYLLPGTSVLPNINIYNLAVPCYPSYTPGKYYTRYALRIEYVPGVCMYMYWV